MGEDRFEDPRYIDWADSLTVPVVAADGQRLGLVRAGFLDALVEDPRVIERLPDLLAAMEKLRTAIDTSGRAHPDTQQANREFCGINERLVREELRLDWPWVMGALLRTTLRMIRDEIEDPRAALPEVGDYTICSPPFKIEVGQGIPLDEVIDEVRDLLAHLEEMRADTGASDAARRHAVRASEEADVRAWGRWYYERVIKKTSERAVARAESKDRKTIRDGVEKATRLLSLGIPRF
jgi:hypothetical protein